MVCQESTSDGGHQLDEAKGDVKENGSKRVEAERLHDQRTKRRYAAGGNTDGEQESGPAPSLWVEDGFLCVIPSPFAGEDAHLVHAKSLDRDELVVVVEELGLDGGVGHEDEHDEREGHGDNTKEQKYDLGG